MHGGVLVLWGTLFPTPSPLTSKLGSGGFSLCTGFQCPVVNVVGSGQVVVVGNSAAATPDPEGNMVVLPGHCSAQSHEQGASCLFAL